mgnify:FL=1
MSIQTANGASLPAGPTPGQRGVREYRHSDIEAAVGDVQDADGVLDTLDQSIDLVSAILTVVIAGAAAYAGINVMCNIAATMSLGDGDSFYTASQNLEEGVASFFSQMPTVFVVIALVLIIGYLTILRR